VAVWREVEDALEAIIDDYERVNHVISLFQDDRARLRGLKKIGPHEGVSIELGSGPGNFTEMLRSSFTGPLICLDYSDRMLSVAKARNEAEDVGFVRGIFSLYMRYIVPLLGGLVTHHGTKNPWRILYKTYELLPVNRELESLMGNILGNAEVEERVLGGLVVATAVKV